jgi:predicted transcriptional regulator
MRTKAPQGLYIPTPKLNQLHILKQVASDPDITQAELAQRCALSVAMVNNYMKELCHGGLLEYRRKSSKSISYHLTVAGKEAADATRLELLQELVRLFTDAKERVREMISCQTHSDLRRVVLYGSGDLAEIAFHALESADVNIVGICDDDPAKIGHDWCGREVLNPHQIRFIAPDSVVIASLVRTDEIFRSLSHLQSRGIHLIRLDGLGAVGICQGPAMSSNGIGDLLLSSKKQAV